MGVMVAMFIMRSGASVIFKSRIFSLQVGKGFRLAVEIGLVEFHRKQNQQSS